MAFNYGDKVLVSLIGFLPVFGTVTGIKTVQGVLAYLVKVDSPDHPTVHMGELYGTLQLKPYQMIPANSPNEVLI